MLQVLFFSMISCKILCKNPFNLFSYFFYKITKIKIKSFECPKSIKSMKKNNTWNIRLLVDDSFVPSSKQSCVIYCGLTDFKLPHCMQTMSKLHYTYQSFCLHPKTNYTKINSFFAYQISQPYAHQHF